MVLRSALCCCVVIGIFAAQGLGCSEDTSFSNPAPYKHLTGDFKPPNNPISAKNWAGEMSANRLLLSFKAKHGRMPRSIEELEKSERELPNLPAGKVYKIVGDKIVVADQP